MDLAANRALTIAVGVLITIIITSGVLFSISQMQNIYEQVYETDTNIQNRFTEYEAFDGTTKTSIEVLNAAKKYRDSNLVRVYIGYTQVNTTSKINSLKSDANIMAGVDLYKSTVVDVDGYITITFTKI